MIAALDIFAGAAGGWSLGMSGAGYRTVAACEIDPWRNAVFAANHPGCRMYADVRDLSASRLVSDLGYLPSVIVGSPPCQDASAANTKGRGIAGARTGLFFEAVRLVNEIRPVWCAFENSPRMRIRGIDRIAHELEEAGYACWPLVVGAMHAGANHERKRVWLIAADADKARGRQQALPHGTAAHHRSCADDGHAARIGCGEGWPKSTEQGNGTNCGEYDPDADCDGDRTRIDQTGREGGARPQGDDPHSDGRLASGARRHADGCLCMGARADVDDPHSDRQGQHGRASNGEMEGGMDGFAADTDQAGSARGCVEPSLRQTEKSRHRCNSGSALPPALAAIGLAWPDWNNGFPGLAEACVAAGFGALDDGADPRLPAGVRNRAIAALGDAVLPQIAEAIGRAMMGLTATARHREASA